mmetsp:Transcript_63889/g.144190  ORF Transcript_63889/g.144190 Transcript_63889/m.144190 type:complete len:242 (+) Transcript_63889:56-781(+)
MARTCCSLILLLAAPASSTDDALAAVQGRVQVHEPESNLTVHGMHPLADLVSGTVQMVARRAGLYGTMPSSSQMAGRTFSLSGEVNGRASGVRMELSFGDACRMTSDYPHTCFLTEDSRLSSFGLKLKMPDALDADSRITSETTLSVFNFQAKIKLDCPVCGSKCTVQPPAIFSVPEVELAMPPCPIPSDFELEVPVPVETFPLIATRVEEIPEATAYTVTTIARNNTDVVMRWRTALSVA